jgi:hypothetical protein
MDKNRKDRTHSVYEEVTIRLKDQHVRELWYRLRSELIRKGGGPEACVEYLKSELTRMKEDVQRAIDWVDKARGG